MSKPAVPPTVSPDAAAPAQGDAGATRLQDLSWGTEMAEALLRRFPDLSEQEIEDILRQV